MFYFEDIQQYQHKYFIILSLVAYSTIPMILFRFRPARLLKSSL